MSELIKLVVQIIAAMIDAMPQEFPEPDGTKTKIPDDNYAILIADGVLAVVTGAGFPVVGLSEAQLRGAIKGFCPVFIAYKKAARVVA